MRRIEMIRIEVEVDDEKQEMGRSWVTLSTPVGTPKEVEHENIANGLAHVGSLVTKILLSSMVLAEAEIAEQCKPNTFQVGNA